MKILKNFTKINFKKTISFISTKLPIKMYFRNFKSFCSDNSSFYPKKRQIDLNQIHDVLNSCNLEPKYEGTDKIRVKICPLCPKHHNNEPSNFNTLLIYNKGIYQCFRCGNRGNFIYLYKILKRKYDLQDEFNTSGRESSNEASDGEILRKRNNEMKDDIYENEPIVSNNNRTNNDIMNFPQQKNSSNYDNVISHISSGISSKNQKNHDLYKVSIANTSLLSDMYRRIILTENDKCQIIIDYLIEERKLTKETLKFYKIGVSFEKFKNNNYEYINLPCVSFPMFYSSNKSIYLNIDKDLVDKTIYQFFNCDYFYMPRIKVRAIGKEFKHFMRIDPPGAVLWYYYINLRGLFGIDTVPKDAKEIVITEGEYDAMAVWQQLKMPAVSLPNGATSLPVQLLEYFERFERIYLWMDADQAGKIASENFSKKLGENKTLIVNTRRFDPKGPKDANDALKEGKDLKEYIDKAKPLSGDNIVRLSDIKSDVLQFLSQYETFSGYKSLSFDFFNKKVKGLRMGEFDILTGETGSGKTTFLTQLSLDFLLQNIPTLWGSFEIKNNKLVSLFLMQYAKKNLRQSKIEEIEYYIENFEKLPLYLLKFHGSSGINEIINTMEYAIYHYDIQNIVLDNLQFMMGMQAKNTNKFDFQDEIIHRLRKFTSDKNVHITLVIHPRKSDDNLKISSIFGSAKASQEADNVYILQSFKGLRIIEVAKNRFDGTTGRVAMSFDQSNCRFFELTEKEISDITKNDKKIETIMQERINMYGSVERDLIIENHNVQKIDPTLNKSNENDAPNLSNTPTKLEENINLNSNINDIQSSPNHENINDDMSKVSPMIKEIMVENNIEPIIVENKQENDSFINTPDNTLDMIQQLSIKENIIDKIISEVKNQEGVSENNHELREKENKDSLKDNCEDINKKEEIIQNTLLVSEDSSKEITQQLMDQQFKEDTDNINIKANEIIPPENTNLNNNEITHEEFDQMPDMSSPILPESKEINTLHTDDSKVKAEQLSQMYRINKKENNFQKYNNNSQKYNEFNQARSGNFKQYKKETKDKYTTDDFF